MRCPEETPSLRTLVPREMTVVVVGSGAAGVCRPLAAAVPPHSAGGLPAASSAQSAVDSAAVHELMIA
jgi:hypothetical protein